MSTPTPPTALPTAPHPAGPASASAPLPLQKVLEGVGDGVWDWNLVTGAEYFSPRLKAMYGYSDHELTMSADLDALTHPDDLARMAQDREAHWQGQVPAYRNEHRVRHRDGRWLWVLTRGLVVSRDADGRPLRMVGTHTDITERKLAELELRATRERLELATQGSNDGLWDWDLLTDKVYYSPRFMELLGYTHAPEFAEMFSFRSHLHPDEMERITHQVRDHLERRVPVFDMEYRLRCHDGRFRWFHGRGMAQWAADGQPRRFAGHLTDITERMAAQATQRELEAQLRDAQKLDALGTLAGGMAQDFNNLLSVMLGNLELVCRDMQLPVSALRGLGEVSKAAERAQGLVQQMLAFSRKQSQRMAVVDLGALVGGMQSQLRNGLPQGAKLTVRVPSKPLRVLADVVQLQQVVNNLCTNGWQSLKGQPGEVWLSVVPANDGTGVLLVVEDSGAGMSPQVLARVFDPFFTTHATGGGAGLGLSVVHGIVKAHQGRIVASSPPGQGARFEVWLPLVASPLAPDVVAPHSRVPSVAGSATSVSKPVATEPASGEPVARHVVYIDDYEAMVYLVTRMLKKRGYRVTAFERAEQALAFIQAHLADVDLLVTDYNMPGLSGLDVVRRIKQWRADLPMVITSGHVTPAMQAEAMAEGVVQVLNKQDSVEDLAQCLAELLEHLPARAAASST